MRIAPEETPEFTTLPVTPCLSVSAGLPTSHRHIEPTRQRSNRAGASALGSRGNGYKYESVDPHQDMVSRWPHVMYVYVSRQGIVLLPNLS